MREQTPQSETKGVDHYWLEILKIPVNLLDAERFEEFSLTGVTHTISEMTGDPKAQGYTAEELVLRRLAIQTLKKQNQERGNHTGVLTLQEMNLKQFVDRGEVMQRALIEILCEAIEPWVSTNWERRALIEQDKKYLIHKTKRNTGVVDYIAREAYQRSH